MPHASRSAASGGVGGGGQGTSSGGSGDGDDDMLASTDEVKVYKDEGEDEKRSSAENLTEDKLGLVTETEEQQEREGKSSDIDSRASYSADENSAHGNNAGATKQPEYVFLDRLPFGYHPLIPPYSPFSNGSSIGSPGKIFHRPPGLGFYMYGAPGDSLGPPPAHMGITPLHLDLKTGLPRHPMYGLHPSAAFYPPPDLAHLPWGRSPGAFPSSPYPPSPLSWFGAAQGLLSSQLGISHPALVAQQGPSSQDLSPLSDDCRDLPFFLSKRQSVTDSRSHHRSVLNSQNGGGGGGGGGMGGAYIPTPQRRATVIKKPLNAFMIFMKEMRQSVIDECSLKESAAINQILGRRWHALDRGEQAKYYEMAKKEKEIHMQLHPGWSARDNYATHTKKKKLKRDHNTSGSGRGSLDYDTDDFNSPDSKRFRPRFNEDRQSDWSNRSRSENGSTDDNGLVDNNSELGEPRSAAILSQSTPVRYHV